MPTFAPARPGPDGRRVNFLNVQLGRFGEEHQIRDHLVSAECLSVDRRQLSPPLLVHLVAQQRLSSRRDICKRVVDFVTCPVRELLQRRKFFLLNGSRKAVL